MADKPTLYVCHGDDGGPRIHPCRRVQEALRAAGIEYDKVIAAHGSPFPFLRKGSREELRQATGDTRLPALKLPRLQPIPRVTPSWMSLMKKCSAAIRRWPSNSAISRNVSCARLRHALNI